ncbi:MAG: DUF6320 domain-containing protein [Clostridia bacterium]|nr:DUF6320 domain-containing protein [Clostridia bacterium]
MEIEITYPVIEKKRLFYIWLRRIVIIIYSVALPVCILVNALTGGLPWSIIVGGGSWLFWISVVERPLVEFTFLSKFSAICVNACIYLGILDLVIRNGFSLIVIPLVFTALLIVQAFIFFIGFKHQKGNVMPLFWMFVLSFGIFIFAASSSYLAFDWTTILLGSVAVSIFIMAASLFFKPLRQEFAKKIHIN